MDGPPDGQTDRPSYRDARTHLKTAPTKISDSTLAVPALAIHTLATPTLANPLISDSELAKATISDLRFPLPS